MAEPQTPSATSTKDAALIIVGLLAIFGGIFAYYWYDDRPLIVRIAMVVGGLVVGLGCGWMSSYGHHFWHFAVGSRIELRKVVWPGRDETIRMTVVVFFFTVLMGVFFWVLDWILTWLTRLLTGHST